MTMVYVGGASRRETFSQISRRLDGGAERQLRIS
jgi:hypothetical protein